MGVVPVTGRGYGRGLPFLEQADSTGRVCGRGFRGRGRGCGRAYGWGVA